VTGRLYFGAGPCWGWGAGACFFDGKTAPDGAGKAAAGAELESGGGPMESPKEGLLPPPPKFESTFEFMGFALGFFAGGGLSVETGAGSGVGFRSFVLSTGGGS
jgi:hypothetical protein